MPIDLRAAPAGALLLLASTLACADGGSPLLWHDESVTYLYGKNFKVNPPIQQTFTLESASGWSWGDMFFFVDQIKYNGKEDGFSGQDTYYGELQGRLSYSKLSGQKIAFGPVSDVLLAATYEFGEGDTEAYLLGPGFDLAIPGFDYFQLNLYYRKPDGHRVRAGAVQVTPVWSYTVPLGRSDLLIDGYIDWVVNNRDASDSRRGQSDYHANFHFNPQVKYDLGKALGYEAKHLYVGLEYDYWSDKYGIQDSDGFTTDQNTASFLIKYHF